MKTGFLLLSMALSTPAFASSVCMVRAIPSNADYDQIQTTCDAQAAKTVNSKESVWTVSDVTPILQRLTTSGYKLIGAGDLVWTLVKE